VSVTALVTGGAGFIGSHLADRLLVQGDTVRVLDDLSTGQRDNVPAGATFVEGDILDPAACEAACANVDTVYHLAARVTIRHSVETFLDDATTNLMGTLRVLQAAARAGVRRFVLASSMGVYSDSPTGEPVPESHPTEPLSPYGISKLAAEKYVLMMGPSLGLEPVVLRFFNTYGSRQGYTPYVGVATIFVTRILRGEPCTIFGDGEQRRDFVHVSDVARACALAGLSSEAPGRILNVGTGRGTSVKELAAAIGDHLGAGEFSQAPVDRTELRHSVANIDRAREILGYEPRETLEEKLPELVADIRSRV